MNAPDLKSGNRASDSWVRIPPHPPVTSGKEKLLALGKWDAVSLQDARERRNDCRKLLARGIDPSEQRAKKKTVAAGKAANSFEAVAVRDYAMRVERAADIRANFAGPVIFHSA